MLVVCLLVIVDNNLKLGELVYFIVVLSWARCCGGLRIIALRWISSFSCSLISVMRLYCSSFKFVATMFWLAG